MEAQYGKFLDMIQVVRINVPLFDVLAGMPNYGKFLKELFHQNLETLEVFSFHVTSTKLSHVMLANLGASINLIPYSLYAKLSLETLKLTKMSVRLAERSFQYPIGIAKNMLVEVGKFTFLTDFVILEMKKDNIVSLILGRPFLHTADAVIREQLNLGVGTERMIFHIDSAMKHSYSNDDTCFRTILKEKLFAEFDEFMEMTADENFESEFDTEEPPFEKITFNTDYKIKTSYEEPLTNIELKPLPDNLEYAFLKEPSFLPVIISSQLSEENKKKLISILKDTSTPSLGKPHTFLESVFVTNEKDELVPTRTVTGWRVCIDYCKLNEATVKDHFPLPFMDQMLERLAEGIVLGHKVSEAVLEVDKAKIDVISKLPPPLISKLLKEKLTCAPVIVSLNWNLLFELMGDASDFAVGAILALRHLFKKQDAKSRLIRWILLLQEFDIKIKNRKGIESVAADYLSRIENDETSDDNEVDDNFPGETLMEINTRYEPWFADFANYLISDIIPKGMTYQQKNRFFSDLQTLLLGGTQPLQSMF
ncbi:reverse transcriptase domain-containing protein [Tanacetum coccineum]